MNHIHNFDSFLNEANISFYKSTVVAALRELGYNVKQADLKIGAKKKGSFDLITLNGEFLCSDTQYDQMIIWIKNAVTEDPKKYGLDPRVLESEKANEAKTAEKYIAYIDDNRKPGGSNKQIKDDYSLEVSDRTGSGFNVIGSKEDIEAFVDDYSVFLKNGIEVFNESIDTKYWSDYNTDTSGQAPKEFADKSTDFEATFEDAVSAWNKEAESGDMIKGAQIQKIKKLAQEFFKKEKWISVNVIQAMIAQES